MKQGQIIVAYKKLIDMYKIPGLDFGTSSILYNVKSRLQPYAEHQDELEITLAEEMSEGVNPDGSYKMDQVMRTEFFRKIDDMLKAEVQYDYKTVNLNLTEEQVHILGITGETIEMLKGIIEIFVDGKTAADFGGDSE